MQTIHIIPFNHHQKLKEMLLENTNHLTNTQVLDFDVAFQLNQDLPKLILDVFQILNTLNLSILKDSVTYPKTSEIMISMCKDLRLYGLNYKDLPTDTALDQELQFCIQSIYDLIQEPIMHKDITYIAYENTLSHAQAHFLNEHACEIRSFTKPDKQTIEYKNALNQRQELEGAIQDLIANKVKEATFVLPNLKAHIPLIETSFQRYGIQLKLEDRSFEVAKAQYLSLFNFATHPDEANLLNVLNTNALNLKHYRDLSYLIEHYHYPLITSSANLSVQKLIEKTEDEARQFTEYIHDLSNLDFRNRAIRSYELLNERQNHNLVPLKTYLENTLFYYDGTTLELFIDGLEKLSSPSFEHDSLHFYDLNDFAITAQDQVYALMLSAKNYPAITAKSGVFDESYLKRITNYPSLHLRTQHSLKQKSHFLSLSKHLVLSHSISDYEGKPQAVSFAIETFAKKHHANLEAWPLVEKDSRQKQTKQLSPTLAKSLFTQDDGTIVSSVSALQLYISNPYQYFIERGLGLQEPEYPVFDARTLGTINHRIMEEFHDPSLDQNQAMNAWSAFTAPFETMIQARDAVLMARNLKIIAEGQAISIMETQSVEGRFSNHRLFKKFKLNGVIDRIDTSDHHLMIVDYKSSSQSLSVPKVKSGEQLQLLTYGVIASERMQKELFAVYNYGFNDANINTARYKYSSSKGIVQNENKIEDLYAASKRYTGWIFTSLNDLFTSASYHSGLRELKDGLAVSPAPYNFKTVSKVLNTVYDSIYDNITQGVLEPSLMSITDQDDINLKEDI